MKKWYLYIFLLFLAGCTGTAYNSHYIISDTSDEAKAVDIEQESLD